MDDSKDAKPQDDAERPMTAEEMRAVRRARKREQQIVAEAARQAAEKAADEAAKRAAEEAAKRAQQEVFAKAKAQPPKPGGGPLSLRQPQGEVAETEESYELARIAREERMHEIRGEMRRRRRLRALGMVLRFMIFVLIPVGAVAWYYYEKATDMYVSESAMIFKSGSGSSGGGILGSFLGGAGTVQDSVALQEYILSRDILKRLNREHDYIAHFQSPDIDPLERLAPDATFDDAYKYYAGGFILPGKVSVSYDSTEGILRLSVIAVTPQKAKEFSDAIIAYGEELVNALNERSRTDGVVMAREHVAATRDDLRKSQQRVAEVQEQLSIFSVESEAGALQGRIVGLEAEIDGIVAEIEKLRTVTANERDSRFTPLRTNLEVKTKQLRDLRARLTGGGDTPIEGPSMAKLGAELELARVDQATSQMMYASALSSLEAAMSAAAEQSLYLETVVKPSEPQKATRPARLKNIGLVFLILFATYIIGLLTISLIREQAAI